MIDVDLKLTVKDGARRFDLAARFQTDVPFAALYGPSGAGKSLTLQAIAGLLQPSAGHVRLDGRTLYDAAQRIDVPAPERRIGYLFQNYALFPHLTVRENVSFGLTSWRRRRLPPKEAETVQALLEGFGLAGLADSRRRNSPAASSSAWRWRARWPASPRCCCSTSPSPPSTPCCAASCATSLRRCAASGAFRC
jgi:molybdate transport system ATP-binding protein